MLTLALLATAMAPRTECPLCADGTIIESCHSIEWEARILNCEAVESISGTAAGIAVGTYSLLEAKTSTCPPHEGWFVSMESGFSGTPDVDGGAIGDGFLAISGSADGGCGCAFSFVADFAAHTSEPFCFLRSTSSGSVVMNNYALTAVVSSENIGYGVDLQTCSAAVSSSVMLVTNGPLEIETEIHVDSETIFDVAHCEMAGRSSSDLDVPYVGTETVLVVRDAMGTVVDLQRGVLAVGADGSVVLLGAYDDNQFSVQVDSQGNTTVQGGVTLETDLTTAGSYTFEMARLQFGSTLGDYNGDGDVSSVDYDRVVDSLGATFADPEYLAGVDIDLDGIIDQSEVDRASALVLKLIGVCTADVNGDGQLNFFDISMFINYLTNGNPIGDWNQDSLINFIDLAMYLTDFNRGCD